MSAEPIQGVDASASGDNAPSPLPLSNELSATETQTGTSTVVEATPGAPTETQGEGQATDATPPVDLTEQDVSTLAPKAQQAFARFRTENKTLSEEVSTLKSQLSELQTNTPAITVNAPVEEWDWKAQFDQLPKPYQEKLSNDIGWERLPSHLNTALERVDELSPEWQNAIFQPVLRAIGKDVGMTPDQVIQTLLEKSGQGADYQAPAQSSPSQFQGGLTQQLLAAGYEPNDPLVLAARQQEQTQAQIQRQLQTYEQRIGQFETQTKQQTQAQLEAAQRQRDAEFDSSREATWKTILGPALDTIPQGYDRYKRSVTVEAKDTVNSDSLAQNHLTNAKNALIQAHQYRTQGTPELADRAMSKHSREMTAYAARCAVITQQVLKPYSDLIAENVALKNGATHQQQQRRDLLGGGGNGQNGNGGPEPRRRDPQTGAWLESVDEAVARATEWRRARTAEIDSSR